MTHICVVELGHHWFKIWLVACSAPSHYLNQCWNIVNRTSRNKFQWKLNQNSNIFIQEIAFENVVCTMASIFSRPQWVKSITYADVVLSTFDLRCKYPHISCKYWFSRTLGFSQKSYFSSFDLSCVAYSPKNVDPYSTPLNDIQGIADIVLFMLDYDSL